MSSFVIKLIAIITMLFDHTGDLISYPLFNVIGRIAFPLFAFQLVIGYINTKNIYKYFKRLLVFALISELPYYLFFKSFGGVLNVFFTMLLGLTCMYIFDKREIKFPLKLIFIAIILIIAQVTKVDYEALGVAFILSIYIVYKNCLIKQKNEDKNWRNIINSVALISICIAFALLRYIRYLGILPLYYIIELIFSTFIPVVVMLLYNGKKGPSMKYFFYIFYPAHLIILCILKFFVLNQAVL